MSQQAALGAVLDALNTALPAQVRAYDLHKVPVKRPTDYVTLMLMRRPGGALTLGARSGIVGYRVRVRALSSTSADNVRTTLERCRVALEFTTLAVGAQSSTPIQFETQDDLLDDDGWFAAFDDYTFAI